MIPLIVAFWFFLALTTVFALGMLWRLVRWPVQSVASLRTRATNALRDLDEAQQNAAVIKDISNVLIDALGSFTDFGARSDTLPPILVLGVFTLIFALLTVVVAWLGKP
ncbi:MAG: hypothetical protein ACYDA5_11910 [Vulcanimicrobiaceae bacterium]